MAKKLWAVELKHPERGWELWGEPMAGEAEARRVMNGLREAQVRAPYRLVELDVLRSDGPVPTR